MNEFRQNIINKLPQFTLDDFNYFLDGSREKVQALKLAKDCDICTSYVDCIDPEYTRYKYCLKNCGFKCLGITSGTYKRIPGAKLPTSKPESLAVKQRNHFKSKYPKSIILMKMGDFYEGFEDDAIILNKIFGMTLTKRSGVKMAGFPWHSLESYLSKIVQAGFSVAICERVEKPTSKVIKRDIVRLVSDR